LIGAGHKKLLNRDNQRVNPGAKMIDPEVDPLRDDWACEKRIASGMPRDFGRKDHTVERAFELQNHSRLTSSNTGIAYAMIGAVF
jgi:hypothetical protein